MKHSEIITILRHPEVKNELAKQMGEYLDAVAKKENANSKQAAKREKRA